MQLDNNLRNKAIGDLSVHEYCQELKSTADLMSNLDAPVADKTLVMYMLNGLNEKFDYVLNVIKHQKPFPTFEEAKNMLEMEETRLKKTQKVTASHNDHSSSSSALVATTPTNPPQQQHNNHRSNSGRGNRRGNKFRGRYNKNNFHQRPNYNNWNPPPFWYGPYTNENIGIFFQTPPECQRPGLESCTRRMIIMIIHTLRSRIVLWDSLSPSRLNPKFTNQILEPGRLE